jgi:hypothetical protein
MEKGEEREELLLLLLTIIFGLDEISSTHQDEGSLAQHQTERRLSHCWECSVKNGLSHYYLEPHVEPCVHEIRTCTW